MADINDYVDNLNYQFNEREKSLMDIFAECWEYCRGHECGDCKYSNGNKHIKMMICMSYQYAQKLIATDVQEVRHGKWIYDPNGMDFNIGAWVCSECKQRNNNLPCNQRCNPDNFVGSNFCPHCGAKMDKE